jgi:glutaredoxin
MRVTGLIALLTVCVIFYISNGARSTHKSPFYTRTVQAMQDRDAKEASKLAMAEEIERQERMERVQREHEAALSHVAPKAKETRPAQPLGPQQQQQPIKQDATSNSGAGGKSVAGRKMMGDHKAAHYVSPKDSGDDGVAKVGNVGPQSSHAVVGEKEEVSEEEHMVQDTLNDILKKGPIIIFSKSYCPYSKKAKHILLDLYDISPPPYVVELDLHELGHGLQSTLGLMTGRRTVPNVLINGKSIGGGDDIEALDDDDKLVSTVASMGGKRIVKVQRRPEEEKKTEMKVKRFKA